MQISYQEKEKNLVPLGTLVPTDVCYINDVLYMVIWADSFDNVHVIKPGTGEMDIFNDRTLAEPVEAALIVMK